MDKLKDDRPTISKYALYDIDELIRIWESGWENLANFYKNRFEGVCLGLGDQTKEIEYRVYSGFQEIYYSRMPLAWYWNFENLGKSVQLHNQFLKDFFPKIPKDESISGSYHSSRKIIGVILDAFEAQQTSKDILLRLKKTKTFKDQYTKFDKEFWDFLLSENIEDMIPRFTKWLKYGLQGKKQCDEAFWNCVWLLIEPEIKNLQEIKNKIDEDVPVSGLDFDILDGCLMGTPKLHMFVNSDDKIKYEISLNICPKMEHKDSIHTTANVLVARPAFLLANQLQLRPTRFIQVCHAPSCGRKFYTSRKNQKACKRTHSGRRSNCKTEWDSYMKWLQNIGYNPDEVWDNPKLQKKWLSDYKPRGIQTKA
jgi:hypothetical protein